VPFLRKESGGATILGYTWESPGAVVEVPNEIAWKLLAIPDADFTEVDPPASVTTFSEVVNDTPATNSPVQRPRPAQRR
jgi:hypothetical protein